MRKKTWLGLLTAILLFGELMLSVQPIQAVTILFSYDDVGRLVRADYGSGKAIVYTYDANGNLLTNMIRGQINQGDVNVDGEVNLQDALVALRLLSGLPVPDQNIADYLAGHNAGDTVGLPELLWILQKIASLR